MNSIVTYKERGDFGNNKYRGNCSGKLLLDLHDQFGFSSFSDYMKGGGTSDDVARYLGIKASTYDLNTGFDLVNDDIKERNEFIFCHYPYYNIIRYSGNMYGDKPISTDLSQIDDYQEYLKLQDYCTAKQFASLKTGGRMAILIGDARRNHQYFPIFKDMATFGTVESIIIKTQENAMSDYVKYANESKLVRILHEYLIVLRKDNPYTFGVRLVKTFDLDIRDSAIATWKDLVASVLEKLGGKAKLEDIYAEIDGHKKAQNNIHWKEKVRQTLQINNVFKHCDRALWQLA